MVEQNKAVTSYTATGKEQVIQETFFVDTIRNYLTTTTIDSAPDTNWGGGGDGGGVDPQAQTFSFNSDQLITSIGVYFATKDSMPIMLQLRNVVNGYPGPIVYGAKTLNAADVEVSNDASVMTKFTFDDPFLAQRDVTYCFVLRTTGAQYRSWVAKMGEKDVLSNEWVPAQPFLGGTMFSSNDNMAWTAHQEMDLKFKIFVASFTDASYILEFNQLTGIEAAQVVVAVNQILPTETAVRWDISTDNRATWIPIQINNGVNILATKYANLHLRAVLFGTSKTPIINLGTIVATGIKFELTGKYVDRLITTLSNFTNIKIWMDIRQPAGATFAVMYSTNDGATWNAATQASVSAADADNFKQYAYANTVTATNQFRVKVDMTGTASNYIEVKRLMVTLV